MVVDRHRLALSTLLTNSPPRRINHLTKVFLALNSPVNFKFLFHPLHHQLEAILVALQQLVVKIQNPLLLTFWVIESADGALRSMNVHLIVNQIKVQEEEQIYANDSPRFEVHGAW